MSPRAPSGRVRFGDDVREIFGAGTRSTNNLFQEFEHAESELELESESERALTTDGRWI